MANAINSLSFGGNTYTFTLPYGVCSTASDVAEKVVTVPNFSLETGARIAIKFSVANTADAPTLNVNNTGAKAIYWNGEAIFADDLDSDQVYEFVYNGTQWDMISTPSRACSLIVTFTAVASDETHWTADKTVAEIHDAYLKNKYIYAIAVSDYSSARNSLRYELISCDERTAIFSYQTHEGGEIYSDTFLHRANQTRVTVTTQNYPLWTYLEKAGGTMTGALTLSGDPTEDLHAATKQYVDANGGVFIAEHSVTTSAELEEAYQANKFIVLRVESSTGPMYGYLLQRKAQNSWYFIVHQGTKTTAYCYLQNDSWSALGFFGVNPHASTHAADGADPITPASIGAATEQYADSRVFTAVYGTTTLEEVKAAYNSGAMVLCTRSDNSVKYILTGLSDTTAYFMGMGTASQILYRVYLDTTWHAASFTCAASTHNQAASTVTAGTFAGQVVANSSGQTYSTSLLRNSKLVSAETNPTVNGEICWTYE